MEKKDVSVEMNKVNDKETTSICAVWDFRYNETAVEAETLLRWMKANSKKFAFQKEKSDNGYIHWQGRFSLIKKRQKPGLMRLFGKLGVPNFLEPTVRENHKAEFFYAMKEDTRIGITYMDDEQKQKLAESESYIPKQLVIPKLFPFQQAILNTGDEFDSRRVDVLISTNGNEGRSTIASVADIRGLGISLPPLNNSKEMIQMLCNICKDTNNRNPRLVFLDMPRSQSKQQLEEFYSGVEIIKNGKLFDCRHHYKSFWIDSPRVWIFTNHHPDTSYLSMDRWRFWSINEKKELVPYSEQPKPTYYNNPISLSESLTIDAESSDDSIREIKTIRKIVKKNL